MKKHVKLFSVLLLLLSVISPVTAEKFQIIPEPKLIINSDGICEINKTIKVYFPKQLQSESTLLEKSLLTDFGIKCLFVKKQENANLILTLKSINGENNESYKIDVIKNVIQITASTPTGIFYGIQTLRQIIKPTKNGFEVQDGTIIDSPAFSWRAFMLDEARHFKGKQVVEKLLDEMALLKMNTFHWHLVDDQGWRIEIKKYPKLTEIGAFRDSTEIKYIGSNIFDGKPHSGYYTQADIKEIVAYAAKLHIQVIPEIEMPGHASAAIAAYPWLGSLGKEIKVSSNFGVMYNVYNVADPRVMEFFNDIFDELIPLFPSPVFHIGGDEVRYDQWNASDQVKLFMDKSGLKSAAELQVLFTNTISNLLKKKGKRMMGWNEITGDNIHGYQQSLDSEANEQKLAEGTIVQFWRGDSALIVKTLNKGYEIVNSYYESTYLDFDYTVTPLSKAYAFNPIPKGISKDKESLVKGLGCQMWSEMIPTVESMNYKVFPRLAAYAECGWTNAENKNYERFLNALPFMINYWKSNGIICGPIK